MQVEERRALTRFRASLLAFAEEPSIANVKRYLAASRRLEAVRAKKAPQREAA